MKTRLFVQLVEAAAEEQYGQPLDFITVMYDPGGDKPVTECLALPLSDEHHFAEIATTAMYNIWRDNDGLFNDDADKDEALSDFRDIVGAMRVAPYMQWTAIYFPGLTRDQVETGEE